MVTSVTSCLKGICKQLLNFKYNIYQYADGIFVILRFPNTSALWEFESTAINNSKDYKLI